MNNPTKQTGPGGDIRAFLKSQHRKVYSICRLFATNYKEQQALFATMLSAISQSLMGTKEERNRNNLLLRACINMTALHSISLDLAGQNQDCRSDREIQFKSPDFQKTMVQFRGAVGAISDYEKLCLFLQLENVKSDTIKDLIGAHPVKAAPSRESSWSGRNFIPYIKQILVWS